MDERAELAWLARRVGFGVAPGLLDAWGTKGIDAVLGELSDPDGAGVPDIDDPFSGLERDRVQGAPQIRESIGAYLGSVVEPVRPLQAWMQFFWHDFFAVSFAVVRIPGLMHDHFNLLWREGLGNFGRLLTDMTTDGAMLLFLDGATSTAAAPNENYGREMLELYSVGVGNFTEADVAAAARALTGWVVRRRYEGEVRFVPFRHDDGPQTLLGVEGVHDVDSVVAAALAHPATAERITRLMAARILGVVDDGLVARHAAAFAGDYELAPLVRGLLEDGLDGAGGDVLIEPFPWLVAAIRATGLPRRGDRVAQSLRIAGQVPMLPPNVGGFPPPSSYLGTSATLARFNIASELAAGARSGTAAAAAAASGDLTGLADAFGLVEGFSAPTADALAALSDPTDRLAAALAAPDLIVA